jgi:hypothetical protein
MSYSDILNTISTETEYIQGGGFSKKVDYHKKYLKYKSKYLQTKNLQQGGNKLSKIDAMRLFNIYKLLYQRKYEQNILAIKNKNQIKYLIIFQIVLNIF